MANRMAVIGFAIIALISSYIIDGLYLQREIEALADGIESGQIKQVVIYSYPLNLFRQLPIEPSSFDNVSKEEAEIFSLQKIEMQLDNESQNAKSIIECLRSDQVSHTWASLSPAGLSVNVRVSFYSQEGHLVGRLHYSSDGGLGFVGDRKVAFSGCLFPYLKKKYLDGNQLK